MFINKKEFQNSLKLYKIKSQEERIPRLILLAFPLLFFVADLIGVLTKFFKYNDQISYSSLNTYSQWCFFYVLGWAVVMIYNYKKSNKANEVLPQTNKGRFLAYSISNYTFYIKISILCLVLYLIQYGVITLLGNSASNIHLAYAFSVNFLIWGFVVNLIYGFLAISLIILLGALDRKFGLYFRIIICIVLFITVINEQFLLKSSLNLINFLTREPSLTLFCIKGVALWIIISLLSWFINSNTVYYSTPSTRFSKKIIALTGFVTIFVITANFFTMNFISFSKVINEEIYLAQKQMKSSIEVNVNIPLDTTHLNPGDTIKIVTNCDFQQNHLFINPINPEDYRFTNTEITSVLFDNKKVNGLSLVYTLPIIIINNINTVPFTNPKLTAKLKETTLYLNYEYDKNQKLFYLSPYSFMKQFDTFKGKNYFKRIGGTVGQNGGGDIYIVADKDIKISTDYQISNK